MSPALRVWIRWTHGVLVGAFVVLLVTGLWLVWNYRPIAVAWSAIVDGPDWVRNVALMRFTHRGAASVLTMAALALLVEGVLLVRGSGRVRLVTPAIATAVLAVVGGISGSVLAWDQVALRAVTAAENGTGFRLLHSPLVREWRVDGRAFSADAMPRWFWSHTVVVPLVLAALLVVVTVRVRRARPAVPSPGPTPG